MEATNMEYSYYLPKAHTQNDKKGYIEHKTQSNSVIIIGANGSGKSKLGAWMESKDRKRFHRIGAQRQLIWQEHLMSKSFEQLSNVFLYGGEFVKEDTLDRYFTGGKDGKTNTERKDIDAVLSAVFAKRTAQFEEFDEKLKQAPDKMLSREVNIVDEIQDIWNSVFPQRKILFKDLKVIASINGNEYNGTGMSDGERVAAYLIAQALLVPKNKIIIIDEPEIHLHRSIMNRLWEAIERRRQDCLFVYITHDTQFAANHRTSDIVWVKEYDGNNWKYEMVADSDLPEQMLLDILGNRKPVLFVEGESGSLDIRLYTILFPDFYIVPCGSCTTVIERTKAYKDTPQVVNYIKAYGIVDRDYRTDAEISALAGKGVFALKVAEVENLFLCKEVFDLIAQNQGKGESEVNSAIDFVVNTKFKNMMTQQVTEATSYEIKYQLSLVDTTSADNFKEAVQAINYDAIFNVIKDKYEKVSNEGNYAEIIKLFNKKSIAKSVGHFFGLNDNDYCELIIRLGSGEKGDDLRSALSAYLPVFPT
jgi:energy-coupling factor transporter ATP-binding protein EcfA2